MNNIVVVIFCLYMLLLNIHFMDIKIVSKLLQVATYIRYLYIKPILLIIISLRMIQVVATYCILEIVCERKFLRISRI